MQTMSLNLYCPTDHRYHAIANWARDEYASRIHNTIGRLPDFLMAVERGPSVLGCIGLNRDIHCPLFQHDPRCRATIDQYGADACCEQSVLIVDPKCPRALPILIAAVTFKAYLAGWSYLLFAGVSQSIKTVAALGLETRCLGAVELEVLPNPDLRANYAPWHEANRPTYFALDTSSAIGAQQLAGERYAHGRIGICQALAPQDAPADQWWMPRSQVTDLAAA